jgi:hypothetical protein
MNADTTGLVGRLAYERRARPIRRSRPTEPRSFVIDFADRLDSFFQFLVIVQAHLINALAADPELTCASSGVTHRQDKHLMPFAACALRAILCSNNVPRSNSPAIGNLPTSF